MFLKVPHTYFISFAGFVFHIPVVFSCQLVLISVIVYVVDYSDKLHELKKGMGALTKIHGGP